MADRKQDEAGRAAGGLQDSQAGTGRGERYDEAQGGGRSWEDVSPSPDEAALPPDQGAHQDRGQSEAEAEFNAESE
jgi:hypothetical protein